MFRIYYRWLSSTQIILDLKFRMLLSVCPKLIFCENKLSMLTPAFQSNETFAFSKLVSFMKVKDSVEKDRQAYMQQSNLVLCLDKLKIA